MTTQYLNIMYRKSTEPTDLYPSCLLAARISLILIYSISPSLCIFYILSKTAALELLIPGLVRRQTTLPTQNRIQVQCWRICCFYFSMFIKFSIKATSEQVLLLCFRVKTLSQHSYQTVFKFSTIISTKFQQSHDMYDALRCHFDCS